MQTHADTTKYDTHSSMLTFSSLPQLNNTEEIFLNFYSGYSNYGLEETLTQMLRKIILKKKSEKRYNNFGSKLNKSYKSICSNLIMHKNDFKKIEKEQKKKRDLRTTNKLSNFG